MRQREALRAARAFVRGRYQSIQHWRIDLVLERDGEKARSWAFLVEPDEEETDLGGYARGTGLHGYVHADGYVEGLYCNE